MTEQGKGSPTSQKRTAGKGLGGILGTRFGELPGGPIRPRSRRRPIGRTLLLILAALPLGVGAVACVALVVQTVKELRGPASATGSADWVLILAAVFFAVMVAALVATAVMVLRSHPTWWPAWAATLVIGFGGTVLGAQQLAAADWRAFSAAGSGAAIFLVLSVYLSGVSAAGVWLKARREPFD
jgi:hypothetical protein